MNVLQSWLEKIPIRMQSTLVLGLRGPDDFGHSPNIKMIIRWMRGLTYKPGNPENFAEFMEVKLPPRIIEKSDTARELEYRTIHFYSHLMHALEVIGYCHPEHMVAKHALTLFSDMCHLLHLEPEPIDVFQYRLRTMDWPNGIQPDTAEEAAELLRKARLVKWDAVKR